MVGIVNPEPAGVSVSTYPGVEDPGEAQGDLGSTVTMGKQDKNHVTAILLSASKNQV